MADPDPIDWDKVLYVEASMDDSEPPAYHVRDQERLYEALPLWELVPWTRDALTAVRLEPLAATVWLPGFENAWSADRPPTPPGCVQAGWEWPSGAWLDLDFLPNPYTPGLYSLSLPAATSERVTLAGRPMQVDRLGRVSPAPEFIVNVKGFLTDAVHFYAQAQAPSETERDALLRAVLTFAPDPGVSDPWISVGRPTGG